MGLVVKQGGVHTTIGAVYGNSVNQNDLVGEYDDQLLLQTIHHMIHGLISQEYYHYDLYSVSTRQAS